MLSKSMPPSSPPQVGSGRRSKRFRDFILKSSIHSGSFFMKDISRTMSLSRPRRGLKT